MMKERDFKQQVFKNAAQWGSGLFYRLEVLDDGGCTILSVPVVSGKIDPVGIASPMVLAADCCGILYVLDANTHQAFRYDPSTNVWERIFCPEHLEKPGRMALFRKRLWIVDVERGEINACSLTNNQVIASIGLLEEPVDIAVNQAGTLYALDRKTKLLYRFDEHGSFLSSFGEPYLKEPVSIAVGKEDMLYVADRGYAGLLRFSQGDEYQGSGEDLSAMGELAMIIGDAQGGGFVLTDAGQLYEFDKDGILAGKVRLPEDAGIVVWIADDGCGNLYASTGSEIYVLDSGKTFTKEKGFYYSKTLDSGAAENRWHRLAMQADIPAGTAVDVYSYASDDKALRNLVDGVLADPAKTPEEKSAIIDSIVPWIGPDTNAKDMLFKGKAGRFLWVKLSLATYDEKTRPTIREMRIFYPRISYLRYLPAIYQEDPLSKDFLERFLSLFESIFYDLEVEISGVTSYFDPDTTLPEFLRWLASWVNIAIEDEWPVETKREFIRQAYHLYTMKGTVKGISRFIEIYTGKTPVILEHVLAGIPVVLGGPYRLGINAMLVKTPVRGFRLGDDSIVGRVALRGVVYEMEDPFLTSAYRFTVLIDLTQNERARYEKGLKIIIADGKPAHTSYSIRFAEALRAGASGYIGISTIVGGFDKLRIGSSTVGSGLLLAEEWEGGEVGKLSVIGKDTTLSS
jgi:phage tail-like protein